MKIVDVIVIAAIAGGLYLLLTRRAGPSSGRLFYAQPGGPPSGAVWDETHGAFVFKDNAGNVTSAYA
jgi:hypothetical protein